MLSYTPCKWYWMAADGQLFSSANQSLFEDREPMYREWPETNSPTIWPKDELAKQTDGERSQTLASFGLFAKLEAVRHNMKFVVAP